jgi:hypothetical protein
VKLFHDFFLICFDTVGNVEIEIVFFYNDFYDKVFFSPGLFAKKSSDGFILSIKDPKIFFKKANERGSPSSNQEIKLK